MEQTIGLVVEAAGGTGVLHGLTGAIARQGGGGGGWAAVEK